MLTYFRVAFFKLSNKSSGTFIVVGRIYKDDLILKDTVYSDFQLNFVFFLGRYIYINIALV